MTSKDPSMKTVKKGRKLKRFRIAFSFAGEKREFVDEVANILAKQFGKEKILYDKFHEAEFAVFNLGIKLPKLYGEESDLIVPVLCPNYDAKRWTGWEWVHIYGMLTNQDGRCVMPSRFEYATVDGLSLAAGYIELDGKTPEQFADLILERLAINKGKRKNYYLDVPITDPKHWEKLKSESDNFDHLYTNQDWHNLSNEVVRAFLDHDRVQIQDDFLSGLTALEQFRRFKFVAKNDKVCNGTYLCFATHPSDVVIGATMKCCIWNGIDRLSGFDEDVDFRDGLLVQFERALAFLKRSLRLERNITEEGRAESFELPVDVIEEALANALVHRDYKSRSECTNLWIFDDRIEIISPGLLPSTVDLSQIQEVTISHPRNPQIARIFYLEGYVERAGSGIQRMTASMVKRGLPRPIFEETGDKCFKVILKRPVKHRDVSRLSAVIPHNLPRLQPFHGRVTELKHIADALDKSNRIWGIAIDGDGGMGKTSLAVYAAYQASHNFFDKIVFVTLKPRELDDDGERDLSGFLISGLMELYNELARELGNDDITRATGADKPRLLHNALRGTHTLLVLDNLESLTKTDRNEVLIFVRRLPPGCKAILTARGRIGSGAEELNLGKLSESAALDILDELAQHNAALAKATDEERRTLYFATDGRPLLLRWTAGQLGRDGCITVEDAIVHLRSCPEGNDPLEFIFGDLVKDFSDIETNVLCALTYFTLPAKAEHIVSFLVSSESDVSHTLRSLINRALVNHNEEQKTFNIAPLVANFIRRKKFKAVEDVGYKLESYVYTLLMENGFQNHDRFHIIDASWATVSAALPYFLTGRNDRLQIVCDAIDDFLEFSGRWDESLALFKESERRAVASEDWLYAGWRAYNAGWLHRLRYQSAEVLDCADRSEMYWHKVKVGAREQAFAIRLRGIGYEIAGDNAAAISAYRKSMELWRTVDGEKANVAIGLNALASVEHSSGDFEAAERNYEEALQIARSVDFQDGVARYTGNLATLALDRKNLSKGEVLSRNALELAEKLGHMELIALNSNRLALSLIRQNKKADARPYVTRAIEIFTRLASPSLTVALQTLAECEA